MMERLLGWFAERRIAAPGEEALGAPIVTARRTALHDHRAGAVIGHHENAHSPDATVRFRGIM